MLDEQLPSASIATPALLRFTGQTNLVELINDANGAVRQVNTTECLADVVTTAASAYEVRFYTAANSGTLSNGLYVPVGSQYLKWTVSQPDTNNTNLFRLVETRDATSVTNEFAWSPAAQSWTLTSGNGLRKQSRSETWDASGTVLTVTNLTLNPADNAVLAKSVSKHQVLPFGRALVEEKAGDGAATETTTHTYYTNKVADGVNYGRLRLTVQPSGSWQWHEYTTGGRLLSTYSSFGNQTPTNNAALCRVTEYDYTPENPDDGTVQSWVPRRVIEKLLGAEVSRSYKIFLPGETRDIRCQTAGAGWSAADNLVTITTTYTNGTFKGHVKSVQQPNGTMQLHSYALDEDDNKTTTIESGQPNAQGTAIIKGTRRVTVTAPLGETLTSTAEDIESQITVDSRTFSEFDEFRRAGRATYLDGTFRLYSYTCCGLESVTDRDGTVTVLAYDALNRRIAATRAGISMITVLDAADRVLQTVRQGTNGSQIVLNAAGYDVLGRLLVSTNATGSVTTFSEGVDGSGQTVKTNTAPDGGTRIETHFKDGSLKSIGGTGARGVRYEYGVETNLAYVKEIKLLTNGSDSGEWTKTYTDMAGGSFKTVFADGAFSQSYFNNTGQLWKQVDPDGVATLHQYNALGEVEYTAVDVDRNDTMDFAGTDRVTRVVRDVVAAHDTNVRRSRSYVWTTGGSDTSLLAGTQEAAVDGTRSWSTAFGLTSQSIHTCGGSCAATNIAPDGSFTVTVKTSGFVTSVTRYDSLNSQLSAINYAYDAHGRQITSTDARNGTTTLAYDNADRVVSVTTPAPAPGYSGQVTTNLYDSMGRVWKVIQPDGTSVTNEFFLTGELKKTSGSRAYPVEYSHDYAGRMQTMKTWQDFAGNAGAAVTTWNYSTNRGWLVSKQYADGQGPGYTYTSAGRLATRVWARNITTTYNHDSTGALTNTAYSDGVTPAVATVYDRRGRAVSQLSTPSTINFSYNDAGQLVVESYTSGPLSGLSVTNTYDAFLRRTNLSALNSQLQSLSTAAYTYDSASRLATVTDGTNSAHYTYLANSPLLAQIAFKQSGTPRMNTFKDHDFLNRLVSISSYDAVPAALDFHSYLYNAANQRTRRTAYDNSYWEYGYDALGQVTSGKRYWADNSLVAGQQHEYAFDDIGNRKTAASGGNQFGGNLRTQTYGANALNQYTNRTVAPYVEVQGSAVSNATVTVNNESTSRHGDYFRKELVVDNTTAAIWQAITNVAVQQGAGPNGTDLVSTKTGNILLQKTPEVFSYDSDGNTAQDGRRTYGWDAENRLTSIVSLTNAPAASKARLDFAYDPQWRRTQKVVSAWDGTNYVAVSTNKFVYDGWNLVALLDGSGQLLKSFRWGTDLSGSMQGAGGVGGLISMTVHGGTLAGTYLYCYDGNGNAVALVNAADGTVVARYEYGPFHELLRATGPLAFENPFLAATKFYDWETGLYYYGYRYYDPSTGRWLSRDPIGEHGGHTLYGYVHNDALSHVDAFGLQKVPPPDPGYTPPPPTLKPCKPRCAGKVFNSKFQCCCGGKIYNKLARPSGVRICTAPVPGQWVNMVWHMWVEVNGQGGQFQAIDLASNFTSTNGTLDNAGDYVPRPDKKCFDIMLSDCEYDVAGFTQNMIDTIAMILQDPQNNSFAYTLVPYNCTTFAYTLPYGVLQGWKRENCSK